MTCTSLDSAGCARVAGAVSHAAAVAASGRAGDARRAAAGVHRLRLAGELTELRDPDLRFSVEEAKELVGAAGISSRMRPGILYERTEGWAAGLRLAVISLARHPDPERFVRSSLAASARSRTICWRRCWSVSRPRCARCCCAPQCWSVCRVRSPITSPGALAQSDPAGARGRQRVRDLARRGA